MPHGWRRSCASAASPDGAWRRPEQVGGKELEAFLAHLVQEERLSGSSQNQALCAVVFLYRRVIFAESGDEESENAPWRRQLGHLCIQRCRRPMRLPTVLRRDERGKGYRVYPAVGS